MIPTPVRSGPQQSDPLCLQHYRTGSQTINQILQQLLHTLAAVACETISCISRKPFLRSACISIVCLREIHSWNAHVVYKVYHDTAMDFMQKACECSVELFGRHCFIVFIDIVGRENTCLKGFQFSNVFYAQEGLLLFAYHSTQKSSWCGDRDTHAQSSTKQNFTRANDFR